MQGSEDKRKRGYRLRRAMRVGLRVFLVVSAVACLVYGSAVWRVHAFDSDWDGAHADAAIVLGASAYHHRPSPVFRERIQHAITLYKGGRVSRLIFTGGKAAGSAFSEAEVARRYAKKQGVPDADIFIEEISVTTFGNLYHARDIASREGLHTFVVVSDPPHMLRAMTMATDLGLEAEPAATPSSLYSSWRSRTGFTMREGYLYLGYLATSW